MVLQLDTMGYYGAYSFEVLNDNYVQLLVSVVAHRARESARWLAAHVPRRSLPRRVGSPPRHPSLPSQHAVPDC